MPTPFPCGVKIITVISRSVVSQNFSVYKALMGLMNDRSLLESEQCYSDTMRNASEDSLRIVIFRIAKALQYRNTRVYRRCDFEWRRRVRRMVCVQLKRELNYLLSCSSFREIARFHKIFFRENELAVRSTAEYLSAIRMTHIPGLQNLMIQYQEYCGKFSLTFLLNIFQSIRNN